MFAGAASLLVNAAPSLAAYGDSANVFGRVTNKTGACCCRARMGVGSANSGPSLCTLTRRTLPLTPPLCHPLSSRTGYLPYAGDNFAMLIPSKWNPSNEKGEVDNIVLRCVCAASSHRMLGAVVHERWRGVGWRGYSTWMQVLRPAWSTSPTSRCAAGPIRAGMPTTLTTSTTCTWSSRGPTRPASRTTARQRTL